MRSFKKRTLQLSSSREIIFPILIWSSVIIASLLWNVSVEKSRYTSLIAEQARTLFDHIVLTRYWNAQHGGVYVPVTEKTLPNPHLEDPNRDVTTTSGMQLTKINPAYMTRQIAELAQIKSKVIFHITSLKPLRPENKADAWEARALAKFENKKKEFSGFLGQEKAQSFRYMAPLYVEKPCLKCHEKQGYKVGDVRGGISITIPLDTETAKLEQGLHQVIFLHLLVFLLGTGGILFYKISAKKVHRELRKLMYAVEQSPNAMVITDAQGMVEYVNPRFTQVTGYQPGEVIGEKIKIVNHKEFTRAKNKPVWEVVSSGEEWHDELYNFTKEGRPYWEFVKISPIRNRRGVVTHFLIIKEDITERKRAESALMQSQKELMDKHEELTKLFRLVEIAKKEWESTMDCIGDMVLLVDSDDTIKRCNKAFQTFTGKSYQDILGKDWREVLSFAGLEVSTFFKAGFEIFHSTSGRWFIMNSYPYMEGSDTSRTVITIHDTTELKKIAKELEQQRLVAEGSRNKLQHALEQISTLIQKVSYEKTFDVRFVNPNLKKCYELMECGKSSCPCYGKDVMRCWQTAGIFCGCSEKGAFVEKHVHCASCLVFKTATADPIYQIGEHFNNMMYILESKSSELQKAYSDLKSAQSQILQQEKMASIGQLAAGVAHEINNPIGFIMSNLSTLQKYIDRLIEFIKAQENGCKGQGDMQAIAGLKQKLKIDYILEDTGNLVRESLEGADRVKKIVQDLKGFSRVDEAEYKPADINAGLNSTINIVWNELKYKTTLIKEYGDIPLTKCNLGQLNQVFMNILINAAHAIEKQGEITVKTRSDAQKIYASISDTGCGIPGDKIDKIFDPFFTTKEVGKGTGLGLSIAYDIVKKHKGEIRVESEVGKGSTFTISIPITN